MLKHTYGHVVRACGWVCGCACMHDMYVVWLYNSILLLISDSIYQKANKISMNRNSLRSNTDVVDGRPHL